jgi:PA14 domain
VTFNIPRNIPGQQSKCGLYSYQAYILQQGGLVGSYYTNKWFSGEKPYLTQVDDTVNKNWGRGDIIPNVAKDYVSVVWKGYLKPLFDEDYKFYVESNDGVRVYVNDQIVIDRLEDLASDLDTHLEISPQAISLKSGKLVPITVMYYETTGNAMIALYWQSATS